MRESGHSNLARVAGFLSSRPQFDCVWRGHGSLKANIGHGIACADRALLVARRLLLSSTRLSYPRIGPISAELSGLDLALWQSDIVSFVTMKRCFGITGHKSIVL